MNWNLDGKHVTATYCDMPVSGIVSDSRVKFGGRCGYTVTLDEAITLPWSTEPKTRVLIEDRDIVKVS